MGLPLERPCINRSERDKRTEIAIVGADSAHVIRCLRKSTDQTKLAWPQLLIPQFWWGYR